MTAFDVFYCAVPKGEAVALISGRGVEYFDRPLRFNNSTIFAPDLQSIVSRAAERPLNLWRYWHNKGRLTSARRRDKTYLRDWSGLVDPGLAPTAVDEKTAVEMYRQIWEINYWCEQRGLSYASSAGGVGIEILDNKFTPNFPPLYSGVKDENKIRPAIYGGRVEALVTESIKAHTFYYDQNAAYLDVIRTCELPYPYRIVDFPSTNFCANGVTEITIEENTKYPVLPERYVGYLNGRKRGIWTNREIRRALDHGAKLIKIHKGLHYVANVKVLQPLAEYLGEERARADTDNLKSFVKRIPNALIGRFALAPLVCVNRVKNEKKWREDQRVISALYVRDDIHSVGYSINRRTKWGACAWSSEILAEQRLRIHEKMWELDRAGFDVLYIDTDGIIVASNGLELPPTSGEIGQYKISWQSEDLIIKSGKAYVAKTIDGATSVKNIGAPRKPNQSDRDRASDLVKSVVKKQLTGGLQK